MSERDDDPYAKVPSTLPAPPSQSPPAKIDPVTGLPIVNGRIDLSNGIPLTDAERAGWQTTRALLLQAIHDHQAAPANDPTAAATFAANLVATLSEIVPFLRALKTPTGKEILDAPTSDIVLDVLAILQKALLLALPR